MKNWRQLLVIMLASTIPALAHAERIKDITSISGVRSNQLIGYGLVVGLDGTGDKAPFTTQTFRNMMNEFGITLPQGTDPKLKNVAAVSVTAELPPFSKPGQRVDVTVSSLGNAKSLRGGSLLFTPLKGADGGIYAVAQGNLVVGGFGAEGNAPLEIDPAAITHPLDQAMLSRLGDLVDEATRSFEDFDYARALERSEAWFWSFTDNYVELVKTRAYEGEEPDAESARHALRMAISTLLRLFAPFLPFVTEEVWSWWRGGSVHRQPWPTNDELSTGSSVDAAVAEVAADTLAEIRRHKTLEKRSLVTPVLSCTVTDTPQRIGENLSACHLWARTGHEGFLRTILPGAALIRAALRSRVMDKFLVAAPSMHEMGLFYHLMMQLYAKDGRGDDLYEFVVLDMPATGHTLALTSLPDILLQMIPVGPVAAALRDGQRVLNDAALTAAWVVTLPEQLPVTEACELVDGLRETHMHVGGILVNRMPSNPFTEAEREAVNEFVKGGHYFGELTLDRLDNAGLAMDRLQQNFDGSILNLPVVTAPEDASAALVERFTEFMKESAQ